MSTFGHACGFPPSGLGLGTLAPPAGLPPGTAAAAASGGAYGSVREVMHAASWPQDSGTLEALYLALLRYLLLQWVSHAMQWLSHHAVGESCHAARGA